MVCPDCVCSQVAVYISRCHIGTVVTNARGRTHGVRGHYLLALPSKPWVSCTGIPVMRTVSDTLCWLRRVNFADAKFMLVTCSAFVHYILLKCEKAGISLDGA